MVDPRKSKNSASLDLPKAKSRPEHKKKRACSFAPENSNAWKMFFFPNWKNANLSGAFPELLVFSRVKIYISNKKEAEPSWCFNLVGGFNPFEKY